MDIINKWSCKIFSRILQFVIIFLINFKQINRKIDFLIFLNRIKQIYYLNYSGNQDDDIKEFAAFLSIIGAETSFLVLNENNEYVERAFASLGKN